MPANREIKLKQCTVVLTRNCNLRCGFCYVKEAGYCADDQLTFDEIKCIVDFCGEAHIKYIFFTGGEPLTYPYLMDGLQYIKKYHSSIIPTLATNGILLADPVLCSNLIDNGIRYIDISMKGVNSKAWEDVTGYNGAELQQQAVRNLSSLPIEFTCSMVITPENVMTVCDAVLSAVNNGAKQFSFTFFIDNINSDVKNHKYLQGHNPFALIEAFISQADRLTAITDDWWIEYSFPMCIYTEQQLKILDGRLAGPCQIHLKNAITVNTKLQLLPCDMYITNPLGKLGTDFSNYQEFKQFVATPEYQSVMGNIRKRPSSNCDACENLDYCYGGCPILWKNYSFESLMAFKEKYQVNQ